MKKTFEVIKTVLTWLIVLLAVYDGVHHRLRHHL